MADVITYSDFLFLSLIPIIFQSIATVYLWKLSSIIDRRSTIILTVKNLILLSFYITVTAILSTASEQTGEQPIEAFGFYVGFIMPLAISICFFLFLRSLKGVLSPNRSPSPPHPSVTTRDTNKDFQRDANRDLERDLTRDIPRDISRDLNRDFARDKNADAHKYYDGYDINRNKQSGGK